MSENCLTPYFLLIILIHYERLVLQNFVTADHGFYFLEFLLTLHNLHIYIYIHVTFSLIQAQL